MENCELFQVLISSAGSHTVCRHCSLLNELDTNASVCFGSREFKNSCLSRSSSV